MRRGSVRLVRFVVIGSGWSGPVWRGSGGRQSGARSQRSCPEDHRRAIPALVEKQQDNHVMLFARAAWPVCWNEDLQKAVPTGAAQNTMKDLAKLRDSLPQGVSITHQW